MFGSSLLLFVLFYECYLRKLLSNTIFISDDVRVFNSNTTGVTSGAGTAYPSGAPEFTPIFSGVPVPLSLVFYVVLGRSLFVHLYFLNSLENHTENMAF